MKILAKSENGDILYEREIDLTEAGLMFPALDGKVAYMFRPTVNDALHRNLHDMVVLEITLDQHDEEQIRSYEQRTDSWHSDLHVQ